MESSASRVVLNVSRVCVLELVLIYVCHCLDVGTELLTHNFGGRDKSHYFSSLSMIVVWIDTNNNSFSFSILTLFSFCSFFFLSSTFFFHFRWFRIYNDNRRRFTWLTNKSNGRNVESIWISICWKAYIEKETTSQNSKYVLILRLFFFFGKNFLVENSWCIWMNVTRESNGNLIDSESWLFAFFFFLASSFFSFSFPSPLLASCKLDETCSCWMMSSQPNCSARFQSNESSSNCQRIVSTTTTSGSEGSSCDLYLENVHFPPISSSSSSCLNHHHHHHHHCHSDINCISDDTASTRSTCCTNLRWSSASSERAASETYSNSLTSDLNSSLLQIPQSSSSDHHVTIRTSCGNDNPFLQNYDIPKVGVKNCDCTHSSNTNSSNTSSGNTNSRNTSSGNTNSNNTNESESRRSSQSNSDNDTSSAFTSDILSFKLNRELEICGDENYENSSIIYSHLMSSSSTTSSNSSGGCPTYTYALVHPCPTPVSTSTRPVIEPEQPCYSVVVKKNEKGRGGHHQHQKNEEESERRKCSSDSTSCSSSALLPSKVAGNESSSLEQHHYQVPRTAIANLYLMVCFSSFLSSLP